jgi:hypothetical protein
LVLQWIIYHSFVLIHFAKLVAVVVVVVLVVAFVIVAVVSLLAAAAATAVAETLDDADDRDAQQEGHQTANFSNKLKIKDKRYFQLSFKPV